MSRSLGAEPFGSLPDGRDAKVHTLDNGRLRVRITDYGARMVAIEAPDGHGGRSDVLLGLEDAAAYATAGGSFGAVLGRCANRIGGGRFELDGRTYQLATNDRGNTLHGGPVGFGEVLWRIEEAQGAAQSEDAPRLVLSHVSPDGEQGFPGTLTARATYELDGDTLRLVLEASTDKPTVVNLSAHAYFNLAGVEHHDILAHEVTIHAAAFLPTDQKQIPTGETRPVAGTPFDFRRPLALGARIREADPQLLIGQGYDICYALDGGGTDQPRLVASARDPVSGRQLDVLTTQPGLQLYSGNQLNGKVVGRGGVAFRQSAGFAFEAQGFPDAPNHPQFPSSVLRPGATYRHVIAYRFTVAG
ncbi:MAG: galactose mutarotase [Acetobacteraceae bacterium]|nr:galactose mutarotase [Acetobacteraceae bacterium]